MIHNILNLKVKLFYLGVIISILGHSIDFIFLEKNKLILIIDVATVTLTALAFLLFKIKQLPISWANGFIVYSASINIMFSILVVDKQYIFVYFLLSALIYGALVLYAGFTLNRIHVIFIGLSYILFFIFIAFYSHNKLLQTTTPLILIVLSGYLIGVNYIVQVLDKYHLQRTDLIGNLKETNRLLKEHERELKISNNTKDKLFSIIGHDLRSPANSIMGFSELISHKAEALENNSIIEYSKHIYRASNSLNILLSQLLDWARLQTGKVTLNLKTVNINNIIEEIVDLMLGTIYLKNISVISSNTNKIKLTCDKQMLSTVIRNLLSNALKYTPVNGTISIKSEVVNNEYYFSIKDTGRGMDVEILNGLFNKQILMSKPGTENELGTGLGLVICQEYVNFHGGNIWADSKPENGSTFFFVLPID